MSRSIEQVLDICLAQLKSGTDLEVILEGYPEWADELRPLLAVAAAARIDIPAPVRREANKAALLALVRERRRTVLAVDEYIVRLKAGEPLDEIVAEAEADLRPVVFAAWRVYTTPPPMPSQATMAAGKRRLMALALRRRVARMFGPEVAAHLYETLAGVVAGLVPSPTRGRRAWSGAVATAAASLVLFIGVSGISAAAGSSLPGEPFYGVKRLGESARLLFAFDPAERAGLSLRFSGRRLDEIRRLADNGQRVPLGVVESWLRGHSDALDQLRQLPAAQQEQLAQALLDSIAERSELEGRLQESVDDPAGLGELLDWALSIAEKAQAAVGGQSQPAATAAAEPVLQVAPMPVPRPLPPSDISPPEVTDAHEPDVGGAVVQPEAPAAEAGSDAAEQMPDVAQPANDDDRDASRHGADEPEPGDTVGEPARATEEPPPFAQPPVEDDELPPPGLPGPGDGPPEDPPAPGAP